MKRCAKGTLVVLGILLSIAPFLLVSIPPMTDLCQHVLVSHILNNYEEPQLNYKDYFDINYSPAPTSLAYLLLSYLQRIAGPFGGAKLFLILFVVCLWMAQFLYLKQLGIQDPSLMATGSLPLTFSWFVYMGFLPFIMTFPLYLFLLCWWTGHSCSVSRSAGAAVLLLVTYGFHIVGGAVGAFSIFCLSLISNWGTKRFWMNVIKDFLALVPIGVLTLVFLSRGEGPSVTIFYKGPVETLKAFVAYTFGSLAEPVIWIGVAGVAFLGAVIFHTILRRRCNTDILILVVGLCVLGLAMPHSLGALWPAGPRLLPYAIMAGFGLISIEKRGRLIFSVVVVIILISMCLLTVNKAFLIEKRYEKFLSGIPKVEYGKKLLPIIVDPGEGSKHIDPFWSIASAYTIIRGGSQPYIFAYPYVKTNASPLKFKDYDAYGYAFLYKTSVEAKEYRGVSDSYDYVLTWGEEPEILSTISSEMSLVFENSRLRIYGRNAQHKQHEYIERDILGQ